MQNSDPDLGAKSNLVAKADILEVRRERHWSVLAEEPGIELPDSARRVHRVHPNVVNRRTSRNVTNRVHHQHDLEVEPNSIETQDGFDQLGHLLSGC